MQSRNSGFTIIELLVVITIIGILVALLLPALQSARESARQAHCENNVRQLAQACQQHMSACNRIPTSGWGWCWIGDPDCGNGVGQPGGWVYNILPYIDQQALHDLGAGGNISAKTTAGTTLVTTPLPYLNCPTRRRPADTLNSAGVAIYYANAPSNLARTDYGINAGSSGNCQNGGGPGGGSQTGSQIGPTWSGATPAATNFNAWNGVSFQQSMVTPDHVTDGLGFTILIGEKYLNPMDYLNGEDAQDNENMYVGFDNDICRSTNEPFITDTVNISYACSFGSAHLNGSYFSFCDGSVRMLSYSISPTVLNNLGGRSDGNVVDESTLVQ